METLYKLLKSHAYKLWAEGGISWFKPITNSIVKWKVAAPYLKKGANDVGLENYQERGDWVVTGLRKKAKWQKAIHQLHKSYDVVLHLNIDTASFLWPSTSGLINAWWILRARLSVREKRHTKRPLVALHEELSCYRPSSEHHKPLVPFFIPS